MYNYGVSESIKRFYSKLLAAGDISYQDLPHSSAYYIRWKIYEDTGVYYEIEHVTVSLWLEGMIPPEEVTIIPQSYIKVYMNDVEPDMSFLRKQVRRKYNSRYNKGLDVLWEV